MKKKIIATLMIFALIGGVAIYAALPKDADAKGREKGLVAVGVTADASCLNAVKELAKDAVGKDFLTKADVEVTADSEADADIEKDSKDSSDLEPADVADVKEAAPETAKAETKAENSTTAQAQPEKPADTANDAAKNEPASAKPEKPADTVNDAAKSEPAPAKPEKPADTANGATKNEPATPQQTTPTQPASQPTQEYTPTITMNGTDIDITDWTDEQKQAHDQATLDAIGNAIMGGNQTDIDNAIGMGLTGSCTMQ